MKNTLLVYIDRFRHDRRERAMLGSVLLVLAIIVTLVVYWQLRLSGVAMTNATYCGYEEHVHTEECYEETLICGLEETERHTHTDECYEEQQVLVCGLEESEEHAHDESCYETQLVLVCGLEESEGHVHTDECYEQTLICGLEEHTHTVECLVDLTADVEDATIWEETLPELTGDLRTDVVNIAYSQLGYTESVANYTLGEDGVTHLGYTRYGAWYGNAYSDWDSMFVAFCLEYADITEEFTFNAGAYAWSVDLANLGYYQLAESYSPTAGDILFLDVDSDGKADNTAVVVAVDESLQTVTVIQGNYSVTDGDGNTTDTVALVTYTSPVILGYANLTPEEAVEEVTEEVTEEIAEEVIEELTEEITEEIAETDGEALTASSEEVVEAEEGETEANETADEPATVDYVSQVTALYTQAMSLAEGDAEAAVTVWNELMAIWEQIYAEEEAGTLALTTEEYDNVNALTDEVYDYFVNTVGYDPYAVATLEELGAIPVTATNINVIKGIDVEWSYYEGTTSSGTYVPSYADGVFTIIYNIHLSDVQYDEVVDSGTGEPIYIQINLGDLDVDKSIVDLGETYVGLDGTTAAFNYWIYYDNDTEQYVIVLQFLEDYLNDKLKDSTDGGSGDISFWSHSATVKDDGSVTFETNTGAEIEIPAEDIKHDENETWNSDITVEKSSYDYDLSSNSITYVVTVSSIVGTTDTITVTDLLSDYTGLSIQNIEVNSVMYYSTYEYGQSGGVSVLGVGSADAVSSDTAGANYYYTINTRSNATSNLTITLSPLDETQNEYVKEKYVITYTVTFDPETSSIDTTISNTATGTSHDDKLNVDVISTGTTSKKVSTSIVDKSGSYSSSTELITWTIDFNPYGANIAGYVLVDSAFAGKTLTIEREDGTVAVEGADYSIITYNDGRTAIEFGDPDDTRSNTYRYTITYTEEQSISLGTAIYESNTVDVYDSGLSYSTSDTAVVNVPASTTGGLSKSFVSSLSYDDTLLMNWSTSLKVTDGMLAKGTTIVDNLTTAWGNSSLYTADDAHQWFTAEQLNNLYASISNSGCTTENDGSVTASSGLIFTDGDTTYVVGTGYYYVIKKGQLVHQENFYEIYGEEYAPHYGYFYMEAYIPGTTSSDEGTWVDVPSGQFCDNYQNTKFTAYRIVFVVDLPDVSGTATFTYQTTADTSTITSSQAYYNHIETGSLTADGSHDEYEKVYKTDGSGNRDTSNVTVSDDGYLTWKVRLYVAKDAQYDFEIIDTLLDGISFVSAYVHVSDYCYGTINKADADSDGVVQVLMSDSSGKIDAQFTTDSDGNKLTITIGPEVYSSINQYGGNYITITYTCFVEDIDNYTEIGVSVGEFTNSVDVNYANSPYGDDEQKQIVTYDNTKPVEVPDYIDKSGTWNSSGNTVDYKVTFNLDGETLLNGDNMTLTDVLSTQMQPNNSDGSFYGYGAVATLDVNSVKFYKLYKLTQTSATTYTYEYSYVDSYGDTQKETRVFNTTDITSESDVYTLVEGTTDEVYYYMEELDISWVYSEETSYNYIYYTITATIPDNTPILMEYTYHFVVVNNNYATTLLNSNLSNNVSVSGISQGNSDSSSTYVEYKYGTSGSFSTDSLTIYKTTDKSTSTVLSGAVFSLYKWDSTSGDWVFVRTYTTGIDGYITVNKTDISVNTAYYVVETQSPEGYTLSSTNHYLYASDSSVSETCYPDNWFDTSLYPDNTDISVFTRNIYVTNTATTPTSVSAEKVWKDSDGNDYTPTDGDEITLELRYYLGDEVSTGGGSGGSGGTGSNSATLYFGTQWATSSFTSYSVPYGVEVTVAIDSLPAYIYKYGVCAFSDEYGNMDRSWRTDLYEFSDPINWTTYNNFSVTFETDTDHPVYTIYWGNFSNTFSGEKITISYTSSGVTYTITSTDGGENWTTNTSGGTAGGGGGTGTGGSDSYEKSDLYGEQTGMTSYAYAKYTITYNGDVTYTLSDGTTYTLSGNTWTLTTGDLPATSGVDGKNYYRMYYFVETSSTVSGGTVTSTTYSTADGTNDGSITITNVVTINNSVLLPSTGGTGTKLLYEFGVMLILLALVGAGGYRNLSRLRKSLVSDPAQVKVPHSKHRKRVPGMRNRKFVTHRHPRKGDTRAGPDG